MEIKDVSSLKSTQANSSQATSAKAESQQRSGQSLSADKLSQSARSDSVSVELRSKPSTKTSEQSEQAKRQDTNSLASALNQVEEEVDKIAKLTDSLAGVLAQASGDQPENRRAALTEEARELTQQLQVEKEVQFRPEPPVRDQAMAEIEAKVGRALEAIFSSDQPKPPARSEKDQILATLRNVEAFRSQIAEVTETLATSKQEISAIISNREEVALANSEAASSSVRDVDQAAEMMERLSKEVSSSSPDKAVVNQLNSGSLRLLSENAEQ